MATISVASSNPVSPRGPREAVKYRASCDRCQNFKVRCSQDKPTCERCSKKAVMCVYSPLRRTGRPKKSVQMPSVDCTHAHEIVCNEDVLAADTPAAVLTAATSAGFDSEGHEQQDRHTAAAHFVNVLPPEGLGSSTSGSEDSPTVDLGSMTPTKHPFHSEPSHPSRGEEEGSGRAALDSSATSPNPSEESQIGAISQSSWSEAYTSPQQASLGTPDTDLQAAGSRHDCYTNILVRTATLEQSLSAVPNTPPVDLFLAAERDIRALQNRLFACTGHTPPALDNNGGSSNNNSNNTVGRHVRRSCLWSGRPALLGLALLAERVVSMLEDTLRSAARSSYETERTFQDTPWLDAQVPAISARRLGRSFRSLMDRPCVLPIPQADQALRIGSYVVDGQVKARALRRILQLRIRKLLFVLKSMERVPLVSDEVDRIGGPLDWDSGGPAMGKAARSLVEDLIRRVEAVRGRMALIG